MAFHSPESLVGAFVDVDEPGLSARSILVSLHDAGEGTPGREVVNVREHIGVWSVDVDSYYTAAGSENMCCSLFLTHRPLFIPKARGGYVLADFT